MMRSLFFAVILLCLVAGSAWAQTPAQNTSPTADTSSTAEWNRAVALEEQGTMTSGIDGIDGAQLASGLFQLVIWTVIICLLAYLILGKLLPKILQMNPAFRRSMTATMPQGLIEVMDRLTLDARRSVYVIKVKDEHFLVGTTDQSMTMLSKLDLSEVEALSEKSEAKDLPILSRFAGLLKNQTDKQTKEQAGERTSI